MALHSVPRLAGCRTFNQDCWPESPSATFSISFGPTGLVSVPLRHPCRIGHPCTGRRCLLWFGLAQCVVKPYGPDPLHPSWNACSLKVPSCCTHRSLMVYRRLCLHLYLVIDALGGPGEFLFTLIGTNRTLANFFSEGFGFS